MQKVRDFAETCRLFACKFQAGVEAGRPSYAVAAAGLVLVMAGAATAQTTDPWQNFTKTVINWVTGNLGKLIALITVIIGTIMSIMQHNFKPLAISILIAVVVGGLVGITKMFFEAGGTGFGTTW